MNSDKLSKQQTVQQYNIDTASGTYRYYITETLPSDVLLGRGANLVRYRGNVEFRRLVQSKKDEYFQPEQTGNHKDEIAQEIFNIITVKMNGRFLRKVTDMNERGILKVPTNATAAIWVPVKVDVALEKIKQAFRDCHKFFDTLMDNDIKPPAVAAAKIPSTNPAPSGNWKTINVNCGSSKLLSVPQKSNNERPTSTVATKNEYSSEALIAQTLQRYQQQQEQLVLKRETASSSVLFTATSIDMNSNTCSRPIETSLDKSVVDNNPRTQHASPLEQLYQTPQSFYVPNDSLEHVAVRAIMGNLTSSQQEHVVNLLSTLPAADVQQLHSSNPLSHLRQQVMNLAATDLNQANQILNTSSTLHHQQQHIHNSTSNNDHRIFPNQLTIDRHTPSSLQQTIPNLESLTGSDSMILLQSLLRDRSAAPLLQQVLPSLLSQSTRSIDNTTLKQLLSSHNTFPLPHLGLPTTQSPTIDNSTILRHLINELQQSPATMLASHVDNSTLQRNLLSDHGGLFDPLALLALSSDITPSRYQHQDSASTSNLSPWLFTSEPSLPLNASVALSSNIRTLTNRDVADELKEPSSTDTDDMNDSSIPK